MRKISSKKGFTLVELLVVIAVLGIMAGIGLNSMSGITDIFRRRADDKTLDQVARTMQIRLMADDHKLLPASPSSELVYTTAIVPEMNLISQTTGELMIAKATGYKIFGNQNIAQDELNTNDLELYVTFYSDSADGKKHYRRSATISATYIIWDGKGSGEGSGSGSGSGSGDDNSGNENGSGSVSTQISGDNGYFSVDSNLKFEGSEDVEKYVAWDNNLPLDRMVEGIAYKDQYFRNRFVFDPSRFDLITESSRAKYEKVFNDVGAENIMLSNLQTKNYADQFYEPIMNGTFNEFINQNESLRENFTRNVNKYDEEFIDLKNIGSDLVGLDSKNTMISSVTNNPYSLYIGKNNNGNYKLILRTKGNGYSLDYDYLFHNKGGKIGTVGYMCTIREE